MDAGLAAILGAAVGACGTAVAAGVSGFFARSQLAQQLAAQHRQMERQIRADLATQMREPRRQAYVDYAAEVGGQLDALDWVLHALSTAPSLRSAAAERLDVFGLSSSTAYEGVLLEGPEEVAHAASELMAAVQKARSLAHVWLMSLERDDADAPAEPPRDFAAELRHAVDAAHQARRDFRFLAMDAIRADGGHAEGEQGRARTAAIHQVLGRRVWGG
ncbi:hypothetical protein [Streptomyces formicae]|uniref:Uncharacterized protein n=1 Tax=Streptomyces formicae TaxID=1616117 RepID=A0A291QAD4_9ACTN|nr:hypothetical protein [Streptomyces formicae]ATL28760.1 hypothetical protein KY5_3742c [Streptomyces formicae]